MNQSDMPVSDVDSKTLQSRSTNRIELKSPIYCFLSNRYWQFFVILIIA